MSNLQTALNNVDEISIVFLLSIIYNIVKHNMLRFYIDNLIYESW